MTQEEELEARFRDLWEDASNIWNWERWVAAGLILEMLSNLQAQILALRVESTHVHMQAVTGYTHPPTILQSQEPK